MNKVVKPDYVPWKISDFNINSYDLMILFVIAMNEKQKCSVSDIRKQVDIAPNNLTKHLKTLSELEFIKIKDFGIGKPKEISLNLEDLKSSCFIIGVLDYFLFENFPEDYKKELEKKKNDFIKSYSIKK